MRLDEVKELIEKGLTNAAIASAVNLSIRQVQRLKRRLLEAPIKLPKTTGQLIKLLQKKAAQGDLHSIKLLLKEYREIEATTPENQAEELIHVAFNFLAPWLTEAERKTHTNLLKKVISRHERWKGTLPPIPDQVEAMARAETPTLPYPPYVRESTDVDDTQPSSTSEVGNTPEGRELPPSPLVNHTEEVNQRGGGLQIRWEK